MIRKGEAGRGPRWLDRRPNWLLEEAGLGRIYNPCLLGSVLLLSASTAYLAVRDGQLEHEAGARVERYIELLGPDYRLLAAFKAGTQTAVPEGYYVQAAKDWLLDVRQRPSGGAVPGSLAARGVHGARQRASGPAVPGSLAARVVDGARKHAWAVTSSNLYEALKAGYWYDVDHKTLGNNAVAISELTSNIATGCEGGPWRDQRGALVQLTWWETIENTPGTRRYSALVTFVDQHDDQPLAGQNPMGVWVSDFRPTLVEERR